MRLERLATIDDMRGAYSDLYKEIYGIRPRDFGTWSFGDLAAEITQLEEEAEAMEPTSGEGWALV